ncbi:MAG TPA: ATP-binding protein [candidate division Zixibacteria bacterium]|nr:ATP-binding protein [candidate division Zixibacteria bacterium]
MRSHWKQLALVAGLVAVFSILHYITPASRPILHDLWRKLYFVPILLAAFWFGLKGGLVTSVITSVIYLPHVLHQWAHIHTQREDALFDILLYNIVGGLTGFLAAREREQREKLQQAQKELLRADRLKLLGELSAGMAHEVRTPLASILGSVDILSKENARPEEKKEFLDILKKEVHRLERVVNDFLNYSRIEKKDFTSCDLNDVVRQAESILRSHPMGKKVRVTLNLERELPKILGDSNQLCQAVLNLAVNGMQAVGEGEIKISTGINSGGRRVFLSVSDRGPGIPPENLEKIFTPFFTTRPEGVGLGLGIVEQISSLHKGEVKIESKPGEGTVATLLFPALKQK